MQIDTQTWRKDLRYVSGYGYHPRPSAPASIIVHTTNGNVGSSFAGEAQFIRDSALVGCGYLVGKSGQIAQICDDMAASWHAGYTRAGFDNNRSIGIEVHYTPGESWTPAMRQALTDLVELLMQRWGIPREMITTHRWAALPAGRKVDPSGLDDQSFAAWREQLLRPSLPQWRVVAGPVNVRSGPGREYPIVGAQLQAGEVVSQAGELQGEVISGDARWLLIQRRGWVSASLVAAV